MIVNSNSVEIETLRNELKIRKMLKVTMNDRMVHNDLLIQELESKIAKLEQIS